MAGFSSGDAIGAGFKLMGREPLAFLGWTAVIVLLMVLPYGAAFATLLPMMQQFASDAANGDPTPQALLQMQARMWSIMPMVYLFPFVGGTIVSAAVFRAVLQPDDRAFLYLRLGKAELWLGLAALVLIVLYVIAIMVMMIPLAIVAALVISTQSPASGLVPLLMLPMFGVIVWGALRFSLALPASFAQRTFVVPESWGLTRGHAGKLFLVAVALTAILMAVELGLVAVWFGLGGFQAVVQSTTVDATPFAFFEKVPPAVWIVAGVVYALLTTFSITLFAAAWAEIYRGLWRPEAVKAGAFSV